MTVTYNVNVRTSRLQQVVDAIDVGASSGNLKLLDSSGNVLSTLALAKPSASVAAGIATFQGMSLVDPAAAASGTATAARVEDSSGTVVISGLTVGTSPASDIVFSPTNAIVAGQTIAITAGQIQGN